MTVPVRPRPAYSPAQSTCDHDGGDCSSIIARRATAHTCTHQTMDGDGIAGILLQVVLNLAADLEEVVDRGVVMVWESKLLHLERPTAEACIMNGSIPPGRQRGRGWRGKQTGHRETERQTDTQKTLRTKQSTQFTPLGRGHDLRGSQRGRCLCMYVCMCVVMVCM